MPADHPHLLQAFESSVMFAEARGSHQELCVPICVLPATISNSVPSTELSLGSDTAINAVVEVKDAAPRVPACSHPVFLTALDEPGGSSSLPSSGSWKGTAG